EPAHEIRPQAKTVDREQAFGDQPQRGALLLGRHRRKRVASTARVVSNIDDTADVLRAHHAGVSELSQPGKKVAPQHLVAFTRLELPPLQPFPQLAGELQAPRRILER